MEGQDEEEESTPARTLHDLRSAVETHRLCFEMRVENETLHAKLLCIKMKALEEAGMTRAEAYGFVLQRGLN